MQPHYQQDLATHNETAIDGPTAKQGGVQDALTAREVLGSRVVVLSRRAGTFGVDIDYDPSDGSALVISAEPSTPAADAVAAGDLRVGDAITAINGTALAAGMTIATLFPPGAATLRLDIAGSCAAADCRSSRVCNMATTASALPDGRADVKAADCAPLEATKRPVASSRPLSIGGPTRLPMEAAPVPADVSANPEARGTAISNFEMDRRIRAAVKIQAYFQRYRRLHRGQDEGDDDHMRRLLKVYAHEVVENLHKAESRGFRAWVREVWHTARIRHSLISVVAPLHHKDANGAWRTEGLKWDAGGTSALRDEQRVQLFWVVTSIGLVTLSSSPPSAMYEWGTDGTFKILLLQRMVASLISALVAYGALVVAYFVFQMANQVVAQSDIRMPSRTGSLRLSSRREPSPKAWAGRARCMKSACASRTAMVCAWAFAMSLSLGSLYVFMASIAYYHNQIVCGPSGELCAAPQENATLGDANATGLILLSPLDRLYVNMSDPNVIERRTAWGLDDNQTSAEALADRRADEHHRALLVQWGWQMATSWLLLEPLEIMIIVSLLLRLENKLGMANFRHAKLYRCLAAIGCADADLS